MSNSVPVPSSPPRRWLRWCLSAVIVVLVIIIAVTLWLWVCLKRPVGAGSAQVVVVARGESFGRVARELESRRLIRSARALSLAARMNGAWRKIQFGEYRVLPSWNALEILDLLISGKVILHKVTIPEGFTINKIAAVLAKRGLAEPQSFRSLALHNAAQFSLPFRLPGASLEGYLFPDTYYFERYRSSSDLINRMLMRFNQRIWRGMLAARSGAALRMSAHQLVTLASLVEGEARKPQERRVIAGVMMNRLRAGKRLECDATIQYALGEHKTRLLFVDLKVDSPYNTYLHAGLPPGPINNPGAAAIDAALHPQPSPYYYYVARPDGSHIFSRTLQEHLAAIARLKAAGLR